MTTKKREVYQFLARTVNTIQNHVSYVMRQVGPQTGTSKVGHGLRGLQPGAEPCNRDPGFFLLLFFFFFFFFFPHRHTQLPIRCASFTEGWLLLWFLRWAIHLDGKGKSFWQCSRRKRIFPETFLHPSLLVSESDPVGSWSLLDSSTAKGAGLPLTN